jgi:ADP-ribose pyrophosphatase YjhB (NUDIX family)
MKKIFLRNFYNLIHPIRRFYWFIFRPKTKGVKCVIIFENKIFLIRPTYSHKKWTLPGGGVKRNETFEEAAKREIMEEVGISLQKIDKIGERASHWEYKKDFVELFYAKVLNSDFKIDNIEIAEAKWASLDNIPEPNMPIVQEAIDILNHFESNKFLRRLKCGSKASRAINRCIISLVPSMIKLIRPSRKTLSTG